MLAEQHHNPAVGPAAGVIGQSPLQCQTVLKINRAHQMDVDRKIVLLRCCMVKPAKHFVRRASGSEVGEGARM
jgi:hypothetical protein